MSEDLKFQIISWSAQDFDMDDDEVMDDDTDLSQIKDNSRYLIKVFGVTQDGKSVAANIMNYTPYFYIKIPFPIKNDFIRFQFKNYLISKLPFQMRESVVSVKIIYKKDFYGFHNGKKFSFMRFTFNSLKAFKLSIKVFQKMVTIPGYNSSKYKLYESNIEPFIRMMHIRDIQPTGWIQIKNGSFQINRSILKSNCKIDITCDWNHISRFENENIAPLTVASFDIECSSSHGDFPVASKDYRKLAQDLLSWINLEDHSSEDIADEIVKAFQHDSEGEFNKIYTKHTPKIDFIKKTVKLSVDDIKNIMSGRLIYDEGVFRSSLQKMTKDDILKTLIAKLNNLALPTVEGDKVIQIGTTLHRYGEKQCFYKNIITLGSCDLIDGVDVLSCSSEDDMLLKWRDLINKLDPDIITGYNIFGFDFTYMHDRSKELSISNEFLKIGKIKDKSCNFVEKTLSSSALGDNLMKYIDMDGRVLIDLMKVVQRDHKLDSYKLDAVASHFMKKNKNDLHPNDIFKMFKGSSQDRKIIAEYCIQDCELCNLLVIKLETLANNIGMSNVCYVPLSYIFLRGQSIKIFSLVAKQCREDDFVIPSLSKPWGVKFEDEDDDEDGYEGAIVLQPKTGIYIDDPISVLDYASLYPSSMISENLSHDTIILDEKYNNLPGVEYLDIPYDLYEGAGDKKTKIGEKICRYVQTTEKGVLPRILMKLLKQRKETRKKIDFQTIRYHDENKCENCITGTIINETDINLQIGAIKILKSHIIGREQTYNEFQKAVLDGLQSAYKVTANSLYGQTGSKISSIYMKDIAACTTATGRKMIMLAKQYLEDHFKADIIYGDTDSLFVKFDVRDDNGNKLFGKDALSESRRLGIQASKEIKKIIKPPHDLEWEKLFWPMILFSKKRYVANKYEHDNEHFKQSSMGIVMKRRDNANIVKKIYGGILDIILNEQNIGKSLDFLYKSLRDFVDGQFEIDDLVITKSLKSHYLDPEKIAHKVLADRVKEREPGNAFQVNDRIPYIYVKVDEPKRGQPKMLQGERIETLEYVNKHKLQPDFEFYLTNQIMKSILQLYALVLEDLPMYRKGREYFKNIYTKLLREKEGNEKKAKDRWQDLREAEVKILLFDPILLQLKNIRERNRAITDFFPISK